MACAAALRAWQLRGAEGPSRQAPARQDRKDNRHGIPLPQDRRTAAFLLPFQHGQVRQVLQLFHAVGNHPRPAEFSRRARGRVQQARTGTA